MYNIIKKYLKYFMIVISVILIFVFSYVNSNTSINTNVDKKMSSIKKNTKTEEKEDNISTVFVDVKGSVNSPGVYELEADKRVIDAINKAGGVTNNADTINLNLSKKLSDEMIIIVYSKTEISNYYKNNNNKNAKCASLECVCPDEFNQACLDENKKESKALKENSNSVSDKISINNASKEELMTLSGIGESKAEKIISYREKNGKFNSLEDIKNVSGIGDSVYEKIKEHISL